MNSENEFSPIRKYQIIKKLCLLLNDLFTKNLNYETLSSINEFKLEILEIKTNYISVSSPEFQELMSSILQRLNFFLVETVHKQTSAIIRELISDIYGLDYKKSDFYLIDCVLKYNYYPKIFEDKIYNECKYSLSDLINNPKDKELKDTSDLFNNYKSSYEFNNDLLLETLRDISKRHGRLKMFEAFSFWFYEYYHIYERSMNALMNDNEESIPLAWKYYLAIMAVSTIKCEYLLRDLEMQFLIKGGDEKWLINGLNEVPDKLRKFEKINNILAHQPWKLKIQDLHEIYKDWQKNELVHAVLILTNFHRLSSVVESFRLSFDGESAEKNNSFISEENVVFIKNKQSKVKKNIISELENFNKLEKSSTPKHDLGRKMVGDNYRNKINFDNTIKIDNNEFSKHISSYCTVYLDFDSHSDDYSSYIEFNWQDQGVYILQNFYPNGVNAINAEIDYLSNKTSNNIGHSETVDTTKYRQTICTYVEKIFGYLNESFDYSKTNKLLHRTHKQFIKNIACFPHKNNKCDVGVILSTFSPEEIYHIILLVSASKMRLQLSYFSKLFYDIIKCID